MTFNAKLWREKSIPCNMTINLLQQRCRFKWLLWDSELGWRIILRCYSKWRTIPDKQRKIYLARLGFEPATFGLLVRRSTNWATGQVGSWSSNYGTWAIWYFETDTSFFNIYATVSMFCYYFRSVYKMWDMLLAY